MAGKKDGRLPGKGYEKLQELAGKARVEVEKILKIIGKEADLSSKFLKGKINILGFDNEIEKRYRELGKEVYNLIDRGTINEPSLKVICDEIDKLYGKLDQTKKQITKVKEQMKKVEVLSR